MERKLAAILCADVVDYSRLMADDEGATVRTLTAYREQIGALVREHRGRIADFSGDNFLAEFPSAIEAVECAVEIQRVLGARNANLPNERKMQFRIGVHMGDVAVDGERVYGDGVNIAARLEGLAQPGGICISATVHEQVRNKASVGYVDLGDQTVKNIPDQVHVYQVDLDDKPSQTRRTTDGSASGLPRRLALAAAAIALLGVVLWAAWPRIVGIGLGVAGLDGSPTNPPIPDMPSVVVLPFVNMSGDPEQEYFSDGITEDLTNALAGSPDLFVISRNSAFTYKDKQAKVEDIGRELGVRYVLEGSVRKAGERVRITAQLIDATTGFHQWSRQYDRDLDDIFAVQSEISEEILSAVGAEIDAAELARIRAKPTDDLSAYDAFTRGLAQFSRYTRASVLEARQLFERAVELDPDFAAAHGMLGATYTAEYGLGYSFDASLIERALAKFDDALQLDPGNPNAWTGRAAVYMQSADSADRAISAADKAIELAPSFATPHMFRGFALARKGQVSEALASINKAFRLDPRASTNALSSANVAAIYAAQGQMDRAVELWETARAANADLLNARLALIDYYMSQGDSERARDVAAEVRSRHPQLTAELGLELATRASSRNTSERAALLANLREAGLPD
jgi:TolB-like protein/class 3 adenylate cyclase/Tfp pilus assembly protein PilF